MVASANTARDPSTGWMPAFLLLSMIWGASYAFIKVAVGAGLHPVWLACFRCALGAGALWALLLGSGDRAPTNRSLWAHSALVAFFLNTVPFSLIAFGETRITSVVAGVLGATTPLFTLLFSVALVATERPSARQLLALAVGFAGVLVILGVWRGAGSVAWIGVLAVVAATACYGFGYAYTRRFLSGRPESGTALSAAQITCATLELSLLAPLVAGRPSWPGATAAAAMVALGTLGTGVAYVLNHSLLRGPGPTVASTVAYLGPLYSTSIGALVLKEPVQWNLLAGGCLVLAGVALNQSTKARPAPAHSARG